MSGRTRIFPLVLALTLLSGSVRVWAARAHAHLRFVPNPIALQQRFTVTLTGATPGESLTFLATPDREGFGGGNMGSHRANAGGTIQFRYGPFKNKMDVGLWTVTVVHKGTGAVTRGTFHVVMPKKARKKSHTS